MEGVQGDPAPQALICFDSSWNISPFDVGNQLITSRNWFEGLGNSLKALLPNCLDFDLKNFRPVFQGVSGKREGLILSSRRPESDSPVLPWYHPDLTDFSIQVPVVSLIVN